jgi:hypothetical protein
VQFWGESGSGSNLCITLEELFVVVSVDPKDRAVEFGVSTIGQLESDLGFPVIYRSTSYCGIEVRFIPGSPKSPQDRALVVGHGWKQPVQFKEDRFTDNNVLVPRKWKGLRDRD